MKRTIVVTWFIVTVALVCALVYVLAAGPDAIKHKVISAEEEKILIANYVDAWYEATKCSHKKKYICVEMDYRAKKLGHELLTSSQLIKDFKVKYLAFNGICDKHRECYNPSNDTQLVSFVDNNGYPYKEAVEYQNVLDKLRDNSNGEVRQRISSRIDVMVSECDWDNLTPKCYKVLEDIRETNEEYENIYLRSMLYIAHL